MNGQPVFMNEKGLFQNMLITGTIGTRENIISNVPFYTPINFFQI